MFRPDLHLCESNRVLICSLCFPYFAQARLAIQMDVTQSQESVVESRGRQVLDIMRARAYAKRARWALFRIQAQVEHVTLKQDRVFVMGNVDFRVSLT